MDSILAKWEKINEIYDNLSNSKDKNTIWKGKKSIKK